VALHLVDLWVGGTAQIDLGFVAGVGVEFQMGGVLGWLLVQFALFEKAGRHGFVFVEFQVAGKWVPGFVGAGEARHQKEGFVALVGVDPGHCGVADEDVAVEALLQMPRDALVLLDPVWVCAVAVVGPGLAVEAQVVAPVVVRTALGVGYIGGVLHNHPLVEAAGHIPRAEVHFADIDAPVAVVGQVLHPIAVIAPVVEAVGPGIVAVHPREDGSPAGNAGRAGTIGLTEGDPFRGEAVQMGGDHLTVAPGSQGVKALLVGHNQNDVGTFGKHQKPRGRLQERLIDVAGL
jgi:hypothetical protein